MPTDLNGNLNALLHTMYIHVLDVLGSLVFALLHFRIILKSFLHSFIVFNINHTTVMKCKILKSVLILPTQG